MKKRKFPAGLIIALVVLVGGAGAYSLINTKAANLSPEEAQRQIAQEQMEEAMANAPKPDPSVVPSVPSKDAVRSNVKAAATPASGERGGPQGRQPSAPGSSIMAPKAQPYKPTPNDSSTSSQWFQKR